MAGRLGSCEARSCQRGRHTTNIAAAPAAALAVELKCRDPQQCMSIWSAAANASARPPSHHSWHSPAATPTPLAHSATNTRAHLDHTTAIIQHGQPPSERLKARTPPQPPTPTAPSAEHLLVAWLPEPVVHHHDGAPIQPVPDAATQSLRHTDTDTDTDIDRRAQVSRRGGEACTHTHR